MKTKYGLWTEENLKRALEEVSSKKLKISSASRHYNIPSGTLHRHLTSKVAEKKMGRFGKLLTVEMENELVDYIISLGNIFHGISKRDMGKCVFEYAEKNKLPHRFKNGAAGLRWVNNLIENHEKLSGIPTLVTFNPVSSPNSLTINNEIHLKNFYSSFQNIIEGNNIIPSNIYNLNELEIKISTSKTEVDVSKEQKIKKVKTIPEVNKVITYLCCFNALGTFVPPVLIFPSCWFYGNDLAHKECSTFKEFRNVSGYSNSDIFFEWIKYFVNFAKPAENEKIVLILDSHSSHFSIRALEYALKSNIILLSFPMHIKLLLNIMRGAVFHSFKAKFEKIANKWYKVKTYNPNTEDALKWFFRTHKYACTTKNATIDFKLSGIHPYDDNIINRCTIVHDKFDNSNTDSSNTNCGDARVNNNNISNDNDVYFKKEEGEGELPRLQRNRNQLDASSTSSAQPGCSNWTDEQLTQNNKKRSTPRSVDCSNITKKGEIRHHINDSQLCLAVQNVVVQRLPIAPVAKKFGISRSSLGMHVQNYKKGMSTLDFKNDTLIAYVNNREAPNKIFTVKQELELEKELLSKMADSNNVINFREIRSMAYRFAKRINNSHIPKSWISSEMAGRSWLSKFLNRHITLKNELERRDAKFT